MVNLGLGFGEANEKKEKLEVVFRVLGFAHRLILKNLLLLFSSLGYICRFWSIPIVSCMLLSHRSQAVQTSRFSAARVPMDTCEMSYIKRFWKCSL